MADIIDMPKLSDTMTVGTLVKWLKKEGDAVKVGDMLAEVETDKATMELESFFAGTLLKIFAPDGSQVIAAARTNTWGWSRRRASTGPTTAWSETAPSTRPGCPRRHTGRPADARTSRHHAGTHAAAHHAGHARTTAHHAAGVATAEFAPERPHLGQECVELSFHLGQAPFHFR